MSQHKAASLTSNLFARKGRASPASLLIAEIEGTEPEERPLKPKRAANGARKIELNGSGAKKAKEPEELPLLAFVEAQAVESEKNAPGKPKAAVSQEAAEEPRPPASLLDRGARALRQANGRSAPAESLAPAAAGDEAAQPVDVVAAEVVASAGDEAEVAPEIEAKIEAQIESGVEADTETVSGDENVAAIEDAPQDEGEFQDDAAKAEAAESETAEAEAVEAEAVDDDVVEAEARVEPAAEAVAAEEAASEEAGEEKAGEEAAEAKAAAGMPEAIKVTPAATQKLGTEAAISATVALRQAAALRATPMPEPKPLAREAAETPTTATPPAKPEGGALPWRSAAVVALGVALGLGAYVAFSGGPERPPVETPVPGAAPVAEALPAGEATAAEEAAAGEITAEFAAPATAPSAAPAAAQSAAQSAAPEEPAAAEAAVQAPEPSFDIIRIEPDGQSIIAGRATPGSEWILLNNGEPIASVQADANGEWVVLPDASLVPGANAFSLVPKTERGKVAIPAPAAQDNLSQQPAPGAPAAPQSGSDAGAAMTPQATPEVDVGVALPRPKPAVVGDTPAMRIQVSQDGVYELQLGSVRQSADAERERNRLAAAFPDLLGELDLRVQEASVEGSGTFFRVRSGAIADLGAARQVCRRLEAEGQGCLVVRRPPPAEAPPAEAPQTEVVQDEPAPHAAPEQQAQRP